VRALGKRLKYSISKDLIRKVWSKYLRDEQRFDKWGAMGKVLVLQEVLEEEGLVPQAGIEAPVDYEILVNEVFPRTFSCEKAKHASRASAKSISKHFRKLRSSLFSSGLVGSVLHATCLEETAEKFCVRVEMVKEIVAHSIR